MNNLADMLFYACEQFSRQIAQQENRQGQWIPRSYHELWQAIKEFAAGLSSLGIASGDRVALISKTRAQWVIADYAIMSLGAVTVPIYPSLQGSQVHYILEDCGAQWVIAEDASQCAKVPEPYFLIAIDGRPPRAKSWTWVQESGGLDPLANFEETLTQISRDQLATIVYTSGTTGNPKGVMLSHGNILANAEGFLDLVERHPQMSVAAGDVALSFLPLSHILERMAHAFMLSRGITIAYAESFDHLAENLLKIRPTLLVAVPRVFEKVYAKVTDQIAQESSLKQKIFYWAVQRGRTKYRYLSTHDKLPVMLRRQLKLADRLVYAKIRAALGGRMKFIISGGASLSQEIGKFFYAVGVTILEGYGLTETSPVLTVNNPDSPVFGSVGYPLSNVALRIGEDGEVLARGPNIMQGYWNRPQDTEDALKNGWFHTGDIGRLEADGRLHVTDRKKYLIVLSTGKNVAPALVENQLIVSPYIEQAIVVGDRQKFIGALLYLNPTEILRWAKERQLVFPSYEELLSSSLLYHFIMGEVDRVTINLAPFERPKRVRFLPHELTEASGELTPSLKVKLPVIREHYQDLLADLYRFEDSGDSRELGESLADQRAGPTPRESQRAPRKPIVIDILGSLVLGAVVGLLLRAVL